MHDFEHALVAEAGQIERIRRSLARHYHNGHRHEEVQQALDCLAVAQQALASVIAGSDAFAFLEGLATAVMLSDAIPEGVA